jgi:hypothetical protein
VAAKPSVEIGVGKGDRDESEREQDAADRPVKLQVALMW